MKLTIKVKKLNKNLPLPKVMNKGEWVDLRAAKDTFLDGPQSGVLKYHTINGEKVGHREVTFSNALVPLGVAMKLPEGFEAHVVSRSSTYNTYGVIMANNVGIIDNSYSGNNDEWKYNAVAFRDTEINEGDRICQFRVQLSQKATMWQKIMWFLSSGIKLIEVDDLHYENRGGFGSTGK